VSAGFTPGPWHIGNGDIYAEGNELSDYDDRVIAAIGRAGMRSHEYAIIKAHKPEGRANARLIAAAPDLYEALKVMEAEKSDYMRINNLGDPAKEHTNKMARAALAKAVQS
jgi:hypothetical protein